MVAERVLQLKDAISHMFAVEFCTRSSHNVETNLEQVRLDQDDVAWLEDVLHVLTPFKSAQEALEGEKYATISLVPVLINVLCSTLNEAVAATEELTQPELHELLTDMYTDFLSRWGATLQTVLIQYGCIVIDKLSSLGMHFGHLHWIQGQRRN